MRALFLGFDNTLSEVIENLTNKVNFNFISIIGESEYIIPSNIEYDKISYQDSKFFINLNFEKFNIQEFPLDIKLTKSLYECESEYLKMIERISFESNLENYDNRIDFYYKNLNFWYRYITQKKINKVIFAVVPHVGFDLLIYYICKYLNIDFVSFYKLPTVNNQKLFKYILRDFKNHTEFFGSNNKYFQEKNENSIDFYKELYTENFEDKTFTGVKVKNNIFFETYNYIDLFFKNLKQGFLIKKLYYYVKRKKYLYQKRKIIKYEVPFLDKKYVYLPLHFQPEASTSPLAGLFVYQELIIEFLAQYLPKNVYLYIKEHKRDSLTPLNLIKINKILIKFPNVKFVSKNFSSQELIRNSIAVATATGSAGWEALFNKKFVLVFGNIFYDNAPNTFKISDELSLMDAITKIFLDNEKFNENIFNNYLFFLKDQIIEGYSDSRYENNATTSINVNIENTTNVLTKWIKFDNTTSNQSLT